jgi:hypothetical protein
MILQAAFAPGFRCLRRYDVPLLLARGAAWLGPIWRNGNRYWVSVGRREPNCEKRR